MAKDKSKVALNAIGTAGTALSMLPPILNNAKAKDTSYIDGQMDVFGNVDYSNIDNYDGIISAYQANRRFMPNFNYEDFALSPGEYAGNVLNAGIAGMNTGNQIDNLIGSVGSDAPTEGHHKGYGGAIGAGVGQIGAALAIPFGEMQARDDYQRALSRRQELYALDTEKMNNAIRNTRGLMTENALLGLKAFGGNLELSPNPADFTNGVKIIESGGTHEQNPMQGVPMGIAEDGKPNLVEEGEVIYNDYVFSKRLIADENMLSAMNLPKKYKNKTFADIAADLSKESSNRPLDSISKNGLNANLAKLMQIQEIQRQREAEYQEYDNEVFYRNFAHRKALGGYLYPYGGDLWGGDDIYPTREIVDDEIIKKYGTTPAGAYYMLNPPQKGFIDLSNHQVRANDVVGPSQKLAGEISTGYIYPTPLPSYEDVDRSRYDIPDWIPEEEVDEDVVRNKKREPFVPGGYSTDTLGRFIPVAGAIEQALSDDLGLSNTYNYDNADMIKNAANVIGNVPAKSFGQRATIYPQDINYDALVANNVLSGYQRAVADLAGGNRNVALASLRGGLSQGINARGDIRRKAKAAQETEELRALQMNNELERALAASQMQADIQNQSAATQRAQILQNWVGARDAVDTAVSIARGKNRENAYTLTGQAFNDIDANRRSLDYATSLGILAQYLRNQEEAEKEAEENSGSTKNACGGKLRTKKTKKYFTR